MGGVIYRIIMDFPPPLLYMWVVDGQLVEGLRSQRRQRETIKYEFIRLWSIKTLDSAVWAAVAPHTQSPEWQAAPPSSSQK